jgi:adenosine deaminase
MRIFINDRPFDASDGADVGGAVIAGNPDLAPGWPMAVLTSPTAGAFAWRWTARLPRVPSCAWSSVPAARTRPPMLTRELIGRLPKAELHNHLDGSLRPATLIELAREANVRLPSQDPEGIRDFMLVSDARHLEDYLARFDITVAVLQTAEALERVAYEMVEDAAQDNVRYLEVRYCPHLSIHRGLTLEQILDAELRGFARGEREFGVKTGVINCSLRHFEPALSESIARVSVDFRDAGVVAFDLAGGEAGRPPGAHGTAFDIAAQGQLGITVHAGEAAGSESIAQAIYRCHANRIGHGTRLFEDPTSRPMSGTGRFRSRST